MTRDTTEKDPESTRDGALDQELRSMTEEHEFPANVLIAAANDVLPLTRRDMDTQEALEYLAAHPQALKERLREYGEPPESYEDKPWIIEDAATTEAIEHLLSTGPLWTLPSDGTKTEATEADEDGP